MLWKSRYAPKGRTDYPRRAAGATILTLCIVMASLVAFPGGAAAKLRLLALGDSLTASYELPPRAKFTTRLQAALRNAGHDIEVVNAGVSGDTSLGGLERLCWLLNEPFTYAIVTLGGNDALRGLKPEQTEVNLEAIVTALKARGVRVMVAGMKAPRNLGPEYAEEFDAIYPRVAERHKVLLYPFFLDGVAANPRLNQKDGIHPNAAGVGVIVKRILPYVIRLISADGQAH